MATLNVEMHGSDSARVATTTRTDPRDDESTPAPGDQVEVELERRLGEYFEKHEEARP